MLIQVRVQEIEDVEAPQEEHQGEVVDEEVWKVNC